MKRLIIVFSCVMLPQWGTMAQVVQWASTVLEVSSELTPVQYSAQQILGKPNVLPAGGQNPNAWTPNRPKRQEYVKVGFSNPMPIQQIAIAESYNPGSISDIYTYDEFGTERLIQTLNPSSIPLKGRMLNVFMPTTGYNVAAVKIEFDGAALPDYFSIDAVAITNANYPVIADIPIPELLAKGLIVERLDANVNSDYNDLSPLLSPDGKTLFFSRQNHPENVGGASDKEDIWYSELQSDGTWSLARNMGSRFNNENPNFVSTINSATPDGKSVLMLLGNRYQEDGKMVAGVSMSNNVDGSWTDPVPLYIENDYNFNEKANYFMTNTRRALLMSVEREDSQGGRDLYVSFPQNGNDTLWTAPLNLGDILNSAGDETAPFMASDNVTIYFSSNGFSGYGASDVYISRRLDDTWTNWSEPENLGPEINSELDDLFFNIPSTSEYAYYSRGVSEDNTDIFRVKMPVLLSPEPIIVVRGNLVDAETGEPIGARIVYERLPDGVEVGVTESNPETGEFELHLPGGELYGVRAEAEGHISESQNLDLRNMRQDGAVQSLNIQLAPIQVAAIAPNVTITLNNVFFDFDKSELKPESFSELNRIVELMEENETMKVEIAGHTDATGPEEYNLGLSERRARAVASFLVGREIDQERIVVTFFGESMPAETNDTVEGRSRNRRVEFKIIEM